MSREFKPIRQLPVWEEVADQLKELTEVSPRRLFYAPGIRKEMRVRVAILLCLALSSIQCAAPVSNHLACTGYSENTETQSELPLATRTTTAAKSPLSGSISVSEKRIEVEGIPLMSGTYDICQDSDQSLLFAPSCYQSETRELTGLGVLDKATGRVSYRMGGALFMLTCHKAVKVMK